MRKLMLGNEAVARGLYEAGCSVVSSYPGTPSTEITEYASEYEEMYCEWAPNEKVAMEVAYGAGLAGRRSACAMKHVGLNVAADPLYTMSYTGVNAGVVICVADDPGMHSSQNEQDSRHHAIASKVPMLEPADSVEAKDFAKLAFELSEQFDTPFILRMCTRIAHSQCSVELEDRVLPEKKEYIKNAPKYVMTPANAIVKHPKVEKRMADLTEWAETSGVNRIELAEDKKLGVITSGTCYEYVKEVFGDSVSILKLGMVNPLPVKLIKDFAAKFERTVVVEELDPIIENHCKALGLKVDGKNLFPITGELSQEKVAAGFGIGAKPHIPAQIIPGRPPVMCSGCPHRGLYQVLSKHKITVMGDIGCYTLGAAAPLSSIDSVLCMGASVSGLHGFLMGEADPHKTACVIGDSTFMHSGITGLVNIAYNRSNATVIIMDNSITGMTGHQENPTTGFNIRGEAVGKIDIESLCRSVGIDRVRVVDPYNLAETEKVLLEELAADEPSVVISRRPCILLKKVKAEPALKVNADKCRGCGACMKIGCPAVTMRDRKAVIDPVNCTGCTVCSQLCPFEAIEGGKCHD